MKCSELEKNPKDCSKEQALSPPYKFKTGGLPQTIKMRISTEPKN
jgi:hypothetical protein